jgi:transposase InsO family protein
MPGDTVGFSRRLQTGCRRRVRHEDGEDDTDEAKRYRRLTTAHFVRNTLPMNGKVERSHLTDKLEFYQFLEYTDDVDLTKKLAAWEEFYNVHRPHGGLAGLTPYEVLHEKMTA